MSNASIRELGRGLTPQHANGTTIDGDLLDISLEDLVFAMNNIPARHLKRRFLQTQFVRKLTPVPYTAPTLEQDCTPFLLTRNNAAEVLGTVPPDGLQNEWRNKGHDNKSILDTTYDDRIRGTYAWTNSIYFSKPVIMTGFSVKFWQPTDYDWPNNWVWGTDPPADKIAGQSVDDLFIEVSVDNPFNMEARNLNDIEIHKLRFPVTSQMMATALAVPSHDLTNTPNLATNALQLWVHLDNLCIPLHRDTRVRISLVIPQYNVEGNDVSGWEGPANLYYPWQSTSFALTTTVLEPLGQV